MNSQTLRKCITLVLVFFILFSSFGLTAKVKADNHYGGNLILSGTDSDLHNNVVWKGVINGMLDKVSNGGSGILVIGANSYKDYWTTTLELTDVTFLNGVDTIRNHSFVGYKLIIIPSSKNYGGITEAENNALSERSGDIASFINNGGALLSLTTIGLSDPLGFLADVGNFTTPTANYNQITPTTEGEALGITNALDGNPSHTTFTEYPDYMNVLATVDGGQDHGEAAIIGGEVIVPGIITDQVTYSITVGNSEQITVTRLDSNGTATDVTNDSGTTYLSSDEEVITVSDSGLVTAVGPGIAYVVISNQGQTLNAPVYVPGLTMDKKRYLVSVDSNQTVVVTEYDASGNAFDRTNESTFNSADPTIATIDNTGIITGQRVGATTIEVNYNEMTAQATVVVPNNDADLTGIEFNGAPIAGFDKDTTTYSLDVAYNVTSATVTGTASDSNASVIVNGNSSFNLGSNTVTLTVTAEDEVTTKIYTIYVNRRDTSLSTILIDGNAISGFDPFVTSYTYGVTLPKTATSVSVTATPNDSGASVEVSGEESLNPGSNVITITVTNGEISQIYTVTIYRAVDSPSNLSATAGDNQVTLSWDPVIGASGYKIYQSTTSGSYDSALTTVTSSVYSYDVTGLTNGQTYYFVVRATSAGGDSDPSTEVSATPISTPAAPTNVIAVYGDKQATVTFDAPTDDGGSIITGYKVIAMPGNITVTGTESPIIVTELTNGIAYSFTVKAINAIGESESSASSNEVIPLGPPAAPSNVRAMHGDNQATITFDAPTDDGGSAITAYEVTALPGNITVTGTASPIIVTGLTNQTSYTFTVKAINAEGKSIASAASNPVIPRKPSSNDDNTSPVTDPTESEVQVLVNSKVENAGTASTEEVNGQQVTTVTVDEEKLLQRLEEEGSHAVITIPITTGSDVVVGELNGRMVKTMESQQAVLEIRTEKATYSLPAEEINIDSLPKQFGTTIDLQDIKVKIEIANPTSETIRVVEDTVSSNGLMLVLPPLKFNVRATYGDQTEEITKFNVYVERTVAIPEGVDPNRITTGVVVEPDGTVRHVPTSIVFIDGVYYAKINSLTNSTYAVVWNPMEFKDVTNHWAKDAVNNMGARMVVSGIGNGMFSPDRDITRAEFAAIIVRGLGLKLENGNSIFTDVKASDWYNSAIQTAYAYQLINGFEDGSFRPNEKITREQAMLIISKAMAITKLQGLDSNQEEDNILKAFTDIKNVSSWAKSGIADSVQAGIVSGRSNDVLAPKAFITRAEVAMMVQRLLQKSGLINE